MCSSSRSFGRIAAVAAASHSASWGLSSATNAHLLSALDVEVDNVINTAFGANLQRLAAVKEKYDPANFFRVNHNIKPGLAPA